MNHPRALRHSNTLKWYMCGGHCVPREKDHTSPSWISHHDRCYHLHLHFRHLIGLLILLVLILNQEETHTHTYTEHIGASADELPPRCIRGPRDISISLSLSLCVCVCVCVCVRARTFLIAACCSYGCFISGVNVPHLAAPALATSETFFVSGCDVCRRAWIPQTTTTRTYMGECNWSQSASAIRRSPPPLR